MDLSSAAPTLLLETSTFQDGMWNPFSPKWRSLISYWTLYFWSSDTMWKGSSVFQISTSTRSQIGETIAGRSIVTIVPKQKKF